MAKFWRVFAYEYKRHVLRKRFLIALLSLPLMIGAMMLVSVLAVFLMFDFDPVGYVDESGWMTIAPEHEEGAFWGREVEFIKYPDEASARADLEKKAIQGYYVVEADYLQNGTVRLVSLEGIGENVEGDFRDLLRANLLADQPEEVRQRIVEGNDIVVRSAVSERETSSDQWINIALPIVVGVIFIVIINMSGGYLLQAVVEEKENRTMEIVVTSVSPTQLMAGKIAGNLSVGLTQILIWGLLPGLAFLFLRNRIPFLQQMDLHPQFLWLSLVTLVMAFIFVAALMAAVGATATETREAQQVSGLFTLPMVVPFWFVSQIMTNPNGPLAVAFSLFTITAPLSLPLRAAFADVPAWQIALALALQVVCTVGSIWLAARIFRLGMLRYGKRLTWKEIFSR